MDENGTPVLYHNILNQALEQKNPTTFQGIESLMLNAVEQEKLTLASGDEHAGGLWEDQGFQQLLQQRRATNADTKGWSCQNRFANISGNACGRDAICEQNAF